MNNKNHQDPTRIAEMRNALGLPHVRMAASDRARKAESMRDSEARAALRMRAAINDAPAPPSPIEAGEFDADEIRAFINDYVAWHARATELAK